MLSACTLSNIHSECSFTLKVCCTLEKQLYIYEVDFETHKTNFELLLQFHLLSILCHHIYSREPLCLHSVCTYDDYVYS